MNPKNDIFTTTEGKWNFAIAILVIGLFAGFIYQFLFNAEEEIADQTVSEMDGTLTEPETSTAEDTEQDYLYTNSDQYTAMTMQTEDAYESDKKTAVVISDIPTSTSKTNPSISKPVREATEKALPTHITEKDGDPIETETREEEVQEVPIQGKETVVPEAEIQTPAAQTTIAPINDDKNLNCVAIVGVFRVVGNKVAVIEKLKSLGYGHSEGILREGMSYVGVPVNCENETARETLLSELNKAFGIDSWIKTK